MPYFITKDIINKSIIGIFDKTNQDHLLNRINDDLNMMTFNILSLDDNLKEISQIDLNDDALKSVSDMLFQLKDYKFYLAYIVKVLLKTKHYDDIANFFSRMFVIHIGDINYCSKDLNYDYNEKYFDRFVEAVKYCEIDNFKILPFLFHIYESKSDEPCNKFFRPAKEYLKGIILTNEDTYLNYINNEEFYKIGHIVYIDLFEKKGIARIIDNLVNGNYFSKAILTQLFLYKKEQSFFELMEYIVRQTGEKQNIALQFYLTFIQDVKSTLPSMYEKIEDESIKAQIKDEIELSKSVIKFDSVEDFLEYINLEKVDVEKGISDKYLVYFNNGKKVSDKVLSYIFKMFKKIQSPKAIKKYNYLKDFFTDTEIDNLGNNLFSSLNNHLVADNKWVVAFICSMCSESVIEKLIGIVPTALSVEEISNFVLGCLVETNCQKVVQLIKQLYTESNNKQYYYNFLEILARYNSINALDYLDEMVDSCELDENCQRVIVCNGENLLFEIDDNLCVKVKNLQSQEYINITNPQFADTYEALQYFNKLTGTVREQIENFHKAYTTRRYWNKTSFVSNILSNPILKKIGSTLTWGGYKRERLVKVYDNILDIQGEEDQNVKIGLIHPVELDKTIFKNFEPFKQINKKVFRLNNNNYSMTICNEFNGVLVNDIIFNSKIRVYGFRMNSIEDTYYYYKIYNDQNIVVKIELLKSDMRNESIVGNVKFYDLSQTLVENNKFNFVDVTPKELGSINKMIYSDVLFAISEGCF